jgi:DNA-binding response OmpR family regulator
MVSKKATILIVDDDIHILRMMQRILELEDYLVLTAGNGEMALQVFKENNPSLVLLDIMLPDMDGYTICKTLRSFSQVPIIMVTAKGNTNEKVEGLDSGADDYVTKPFSSKELTARVGAILRRNPPSENTVMKTPTIFTCKDLTIDFEKKIVTLNDAKIDLTATEYRILSYLAQNANRIISPEEILKDVWGGDYAEATHLLQVNIARLRQKLNDDAREQKYIDTQPGLGYAIITRR